MHRNFNSLGEKSVDVSKMGYLLNKTRILRQEIWPPFFMPMCHVFLERNTIIYIIFSICYLWQGLFFSICYLWKGKGNSWYGPGVSVAGIILGLPCQWPIHKRIIITTLIFTHICFTYVKDVRTFATSLAFLQHFAYVMLSHRVFTKPNQWTETIDITGW